MDPRLVAARMLDRSADRDWSLIDALTERCAQSRSEARRLREEVEQEREAQEHQRQADAELGRRSGRKARAG